jgi:hypothetical protein
MVERSPLDDTSGDIQYGLTATRASTAPDADVVGRYVVYAHEPSLLAGCDTTPIPAMQRQSATHASVPAQCEDAQNLDVFSSPVV